MYIMNYWSQMISPSNLWRYLLLLSIRVAEPVHLYSPFQIPWAIHALTPFHPKQSSWWESYCQLHWFLPAVFCSCQCSSVACILLSLYINISSCCKWYSFLFISNYSLWVYRNTADFGVWILDSVTLLNYLLQLSRGLPAAAHCEKKKK